MRKIKKYTIGTLAASALVIGLSGLGAAPASATVFGNHGTTCSTTSSYSLIHKGHSLHCKIWNLLSKKPGLTKPGITKPGLTKPGITKPGLTKPGLTKPKPTTPTTPAS